MPGLGTEPGLLEEQPVFFASVPYLQAKALQSVFSCNQTVLLSKSGFTFTVV